VAIKSNDRVVFSWSRFWFSDNRISDCGKKFVHSLTCKHNNKKENQAQKGKNQQQQEQQQPGPVLEEHNSTGILRLSANL
jgi:uncharacterized protein (DUF2147 family)